MLDEMVRSVVEHAGADMAAMRRTAGLMIQAVPDSLVAGYEPLVASIKLPDPSDRHVVAAAIQAGAEVIVTNNLGDFPEDAIDEYGLEAQTADDFVTDIVKRSPAQVMRVVTEQADALQDPPMTVDEVLGHLERAGLKSSVALLRA